MNVGLKYLGGSFGSYAIPKIDWAEVTPFVTLLVKANATFEYPLHYSRLLAKIITLTV